MLPNWLVKSGLDIKIGISMCGDEEIYIDAVQMVKELSEKHIECIRTSLMENDYDAYVLSMHTLKSSTRLIGATGISILAQELESAGERKDMTIMLEKTPVMVERLQNLMDRLRTSEEENKKGRINEEDIPELAKNLLSYVSSFNDEACSCMLRQLNEYEWPYKYRDAFEHLLSAQKKADWREMEQLLNNILETAEKV